MDENPAVTVKILLHFLGDPYLKDSDPPDKMCGSKTLDFSLHTRKTCKKEMYIIL